MPANLKTLIAPLVALLTLLTVASPSAQIPAAVTQSDAQTEYDVVIRNGRVLDGLGNPWVLADVAIRDGRFVRIGKVQGRGKHEIDATGRYVSPGWIDMM